MADVNKFLQYISQIESNGGKNTNHQLINTGLQQGQRAMGRYGLLNNTIQEVIARQRAANALSPEVEALSGLDQDTVRKQVEGNPALESQIATYLANHVLQRQGGNELAAAYAWNNGHNLSPQRITPEKLEASPYVRKYKSFSNSKPVESAVAAPLDIDVDPVSDKEDSRQVQAAYDALLRLRDN